MPSKLKKLQDYEEVREIITLEDPRGKEIFEKLSPESKRHLGLFGASRPGWDIGITGEQMFDEQAPPNPKALGLTHRSNPIHWYQAGTIYTIGKLKQLPRPLQILDIGSPIEQVLAECALSDVTVTVVDVRPRWGPEVLPFVSITGSATKLPIEAGVIDVVTSNCVMCHVGDGRYGDDLDVDGDLKMLRECKRVLKPGGHVILGLGPMWYKAHILYNWHRVYDKAWAEKLFRWAGLKCSDFLVYDLRDGNWKTPDLMETASKKIQPYYGFAVLESPNWTATP